VAISGSAEARGTIVAEDCAMPDKLEADLARPVRPSILCSGTKRISFQQTLDAIPQNPINRLRGDPLHPLVRPPRSPPRGEDLASWGNDHRSGMMIRSPQANGGFSTPAEWHHAIKWPD